MVDTKVLKQRAEKLLGGPGAQTGFKEPDNVFIILERIQSKTGADQWAWLRSDSAAACGDWLRRLSRGREWEGRGCRSRMRN